MKVFENNIEIIMVKSINKGLVPRVLWLDDIRDPFDSKMDWVKMVTHLVGTIQITWAKNVDEFKKCVEQEMPNFICFDHDLGEGESGMDAAKWLVKYCFDNDIEIPTVYSQSSNPVGRENILSYVRQAKKTQIYGR